MRMTMTMTSVATQSQALLAEVDRIVSATKDAVASMDRIVALLHERLNHYSWVGIYLMDGPDELVLGPFRGKPSPHTRIPLNSGICGAAASQKETVIIDDVNADLRYLACSLETKSEIVVPIMRGQTCLGEIDIDSDRLAAFGDDDRALLEQIAAKIEPMLA